MNKLEKIIEFVKEKHKNQKRKDGKPYFTHLEAVAKNIEGFKSLITKWGFESFYEDIVIAAYSHDLIEDQGVTEEELKQNGFSDLSIKLIQTVSRKEEETYYDFIKRITRSEYKMLSSLIKLADLQHNMRDLNEGSLKDKYRFAEDYILDKFVK